MNLKVMASGFAVAALLIASSVYGVIATNSNPVVNERFSMSTLTKPSPITPRANAAKPQDLPPAVGADVVGFYGQTLLSTEDVSTRLQLIRNLRTAGPAAKNGSVGVREPQAFEILAAAYAEETDVRVKIAIVESLSEFTVPEAAELLNRASEDSNPAVREAAQQAKQKRDMRLLFTRCCG